MVVWVLITWSFTVQELVAGVLVSLATAVFCSRFFAHGDSFRFFNPVKIFSLLANVADVKSLVVHPYTTTHSELSPKELAEAGISPATVRLSIGTEHYEDIINDLDQALNAI